MPHVGQLKSAVQKDLLVAPKKIDCFVFENCLTEKQLSTDEKIQNAFRFFPRTFVSIFIVHFFFFFLQNAIFSSVSSTGTRGAPIINTDLHHTSPITQNWNDSIRNTRESLYLKEAFP